MNCQDFEKIINDLAREQMMEARERAGGLAHAEECQRCAARLRDERALSGGLRSLALSAERLEAPARVEAALLSAFRSPDRVTPVTTTIQPAATVAPIIPVAPAATTVAPHRWRWATGIAAALSLLFVAFAATRLQSRPPAQLASAHDPQPLSVVWDSSAQGRQAALDTSASTTRVRGEVSSRFVSLRTQGRERRGVESVGGNRSGASGGTQPFVNTMASASTSTVDDDDDIATDFIPLSYGADLGGTDGGHVVRVELPRTAMAQFGLPVNAERSAEPVKADVLLGEDGLARAIRFVR